MRERPWIATPAPERTASGCASVAPPGTSSGADIRVGLSFWRTYDRAVRVRERDLVERVDGNRQCDGAGLQAERT
ncbi:hypothetical protein Kisp02_50740 [Kineosporia sp. NBRC 101731]|nr:hypothetical protein Kisp02_50740 [Kineosporia sp. NBRC 101731]